MGHHTSQHRDMCQGMSVVSEHTPIHRNKQDCLVASTSKISKIITDTLEWASSHVWRCSLHEKMTRYEAIWMFKISGFPRSIYQHTSWCWSMWIQCVFPFSLPYFRPQVGWITIPQSKLILHKLHKVVKIGRCCFNIIVKFGSLDRSITFI